MIKAITSIQADCERLGLVEDSRVLKAWLSHGLPHLSEETVLLKEVYDLYRSVSTLPPSTVPQTTLSLQTLPYHTTGKGVRQIMGELGYLIYLIYQQGFSQHNIHDLPDDIRSNHIKLGIIIQDLIVLFGIYYNAANRKEDVLAAETEQMFSLWNTHIGSLVTKLAESLIRIKEHAFEMIEAEGARHFIEDNEELKKQALLFFQKTDQIILEIRKSFYQKNQLSFSEIGSIQSLLQKLRDFLNGLKAITSGLDLEGGRYNPEALMYWSIVFSGKKERYKSGKQKRAEIIQDLLNRPYLSECSVDLESKSELLEGIADDVIKAHKAFQENLKILIIVNDKIREVLVEALAFKTKIDAFIPSMSLLKAAIETVKTAHKGEKLSSSQFTALVQENLNKNKQTIVSLAIPTILNTYQRFYSEKPIPSNLGAFEIDREIQLLQDLSKIVDKNIQQAYASWRGDFHKDSSEDLPKGSIQNFQIGDPINELHSQIYRISNYFKENAQNPLGQLNEDEKVIAETLLVGKVFKEDGSFSEGFNRMASEILKTRSYLEKEGTEQDKKEDIARKIADFNFLLKAILTETDLPDKLDIEALETFVKNIVEDRRQERREIMENEYGEIPLSSDSIDKTIKDFSYTAQDFNNWLIERVFKKTSLDKLQKEADLKIGVMSKPISASFNNSNFQKNILAAKEEAVKFSITRQGPSGLEKGYVRVAVDLSSQKLKCRLFITEASGESYTVGRPLERDLCPSEEISQEVADILKEYKVDSLSNLSANKEKIETWYKKAIATSAETLAKTSAETSTSEPIPTNPRPVYLPEVGTETAPVNRRRGPGSKEEDGKKSSRISLDPERIKEQAITEPATISGCSNNAKYKELLESRVKRLVQHSSRMLSVTEQTFSHLANQIEEAAILFFDKEGPLSAFPRITYNVYSRTSSASELWKDWKATKIEVPLHEIETLVENLVATEKIREEFTERPVENLNGIPLVTIDRIDEKFEELVKLVRQ